MSKKERDRRRGYKENK